MAGRKASKGSRSRGVAVGTEERWRLIEDCAFFRVERYREVRPGEVRGQDLAAAAADIDAAIGRRRRRRGKR
jgi:hypothetical protein